MNGEKISAKSFQYFITSATFFFLIYLLFNIQYSYSGIIGYDGYYHIKMAEQMADKSIFHPDASLMYIPGEEQFVDHHFLYHILLIPFTFFGLLTGAKNSAIFFVVLLLVTLIFVLNRIKAKQIYLWILILFSLSGTFLFRISLPRAAVPSLIILVLSWYFMIRRRHIPLFLLCFLFPNFYGGFSAILIPLGGVFLSVLVIERQLIYKTLTSVISGIALGLVMNPFFPSNVKFIYLQTTSAGLLRVAKGGSEWMSFSPEKFVTTQFPFLFLFFLSIYIASIAEKKMKKDCLSLLFITLPLIVISFFWRRFIEISVPFSLLFAASVFRDYGSDYLKSLKINGENSSRIIAISLALFFLMTSILTANSTGKDIASDLRSPGRYSGAAKWLNENGISMSVYLTDWDDYPELFFYNSSNRYLIGLDPAFLYIYDKTMYKIWIDINSGRYEGDLKSAFRDIFKTPFIFTDNTHNEFIRIIDGKDWAQLRYKDSYCRIYSISP